MFSFRIAHLATTEFNPGLTWVLVYPVNAMDTRVPATRQLAFASTVSTTLSEITASSVRYFLN